MYRQLLCMLPKIFLLVSPSDIKKKLSSPACYLPTPSSPQFISNRWFAGGVTSDVNPFCAYSLAAAVENRRRCCLILFLSALTTSPPSTPCVRRTSISLSCEDSGSDAGEGDVSELVGLFNKDGMESALVVRVFDSVMNLSCASWTAFSVVGQ